MVIESGVAVGYFIAWLLSKARRVGSGLNRETDGVLDTGLERLHQVIQAKLGNDPALRKANDEAEATGEVAARTRQRLEQAVEDAAEADLSFDSQVDKLIHQIRAREVALGRASASGAGAVAVGRDVNISATDGAAAAWQVGSIHLGSPHSSSSPPEAHTSTTEDATSAAPTQRSAADNPQ